jgi:hypothetical protein
MSNQQKAEKNMVENGRFTVPLYHGTSAVFLASIRAFGLGAENPHHRLNTIELLRELNAIAEIHLQADEWYLIEKFSIENMVAQEVTASRLNFRHGSVYLTPAKMVAVRYAVSNSLGSELLSYAIELFGRLREFGCGQLDAITGRYSNALSLVDKPREPVLIEARDIPLENLRAESGGDAGSTADRIADTAASLDPELVPEVWGQFNFELLAPIAPGQLSCYKVHWTNNDPLFPQYELEPLCQ